MATELIDKALLDILRCPASGQPLQIDGDGLITVDGFRRYGLVDGIPILTLESYEPTHRGYKTVIDQNKKKMNECSIFNEEDFARFIEGMIVPTCGNLFYGVHFSGEYPIPNFPIFSGGMVLDVGCNWGRWSIAGAKADYRIVGVDIHLESLLAARWLARKLVPHNEPFFVLADARHLPFAPESFGGVFSYSVIQHFSRKNAGAILSELHDVMKRGAKSVVQMPNKTGLGAMLTKRSIRNSQGAEFDVRY